MFVGNCFAGVTKTQIITLRLAANTVPEIHLRPLIRQR